MSEHDAELVQAVATKVARAELMKRGLITITTVLVIAVLVLGYRTLTTVQTAVREIRATQESGSPVLRAIIAQQEDIQATATITAQLAALLFGCFDPSSECAKESAAREAEQRGAYNAAVIAAQYCTDQILPRVYTLEELTNCVGQRLDGHEGDQR